MNKIVKLVLLLGILLGFKSLGVCGDYYVRTGTQVFVSSDTSFAITRLYVSTGMADASYCVLIDSSPINASLGHASLLPLTNAAWNETQFLTPRIYPQTSTSDLNCQVGCMTVLTWEYDPINVKNGLVFACNMLTSPAYIPQFGVYTIPTPASHRGRD